MPRRRPKLPGKTQLTDLQVDGTTVVVDETNNRLGIGTASPGAALGIDGDIQLAPTATSTGHITSTGSLNVRASNNIRIGDDGADSVRLGRINTSAAKVHIRSGADTDLVVSGSKVGIGTEEPKTDLTIEGTITLKEQAAADSDTAAYGQLWVKTATPNELYFTTDAGDDIQITTGTGMAGGSGDITGVTAGDGLSGGGTSGGVSLALDLKSNGGLEIQSGEVSVAQGISQYDVAQFAASVADNDFLRIDGTAVEGLSAAEVAAAIEGSIDAVGTIASGTWQGTAIARAYIADDAINGDKIADDAINSEHYTDGSIDTDHIADDQVTLAKMAGLARGSIIVGNASGDPTALSVGSDNHVLTVDSNGDIGWEAASGGSVDLNGLSAAAVAVAADSIAIIDADDSNNSKKESIADLVSAMAGTGLAASSGQLTVSAANTGTALASGGVRATPDMAGEILATQVFS